MSGPIWNKILIGRDKAVLASAGAGERGGFGKRPALLIIDVNWAFCGDRPEPILESKRWRNSCGEDTWTALPYIRSLIDKCHENGVPVMYTTGVRRDELGHQFLRLEEFAQRRPSSPTSTTTRS